LSKPSLRTVARARFSGCNNHPESAVDASTIATISSFAN
jgi:hypothetical protein